MHITTSDTAEATRQDEPISDVNTFDEVALVEQTMIETFNINLAGHTMTDQTESNTAIAQAMPGKIRSRYTYLDLFEWLDEKIPSPQLKARVFSSMAWMLDIFTINMARNIWFQIHAQAREQGIEMNGEHVTIESYNEFMKFFTTHDIANALTTSFYKGKLNDDGTVGAPDQFDAEIRDEMVSQPWRDLMQMVKLHNVWHAAAAQQLDASRTVIELKREYSVKSYEELAMEEKLFIDHDEIAKLRELGKLIAPAQAEQIGDMYERARVSAAEDRVKSNRENAHWVLKIIAEAQNRGDDRDQDAAFYDLSLPLQKRLCEQAAKAIGRSIEQLAKVKGISLMDYVPMAQLALAARAELQVVIDEKFAD